MELFLSLLFGAVGGVYLAYAKRQHDAFYLVVGFLLIVYPYFFESAVAIVLVGTVLAAVPFARMKGLI